MSLYVCGDTHRDCDIKKITGKHFKEGKSLTPDDYLLVCGDCGVVLDPGRFDDYIRNWYANKPWTTLFIDGNHENHDVLGSLPVTEWKGGKVHVVSPSIIHLMRGQVYNIDGHVLFTMGGATSHDKELRIEGLNWWRGELPCEEEYLEAKANLARFDNKVDYIFTHCAPTSIQARMGEKYKEDDLTHFLEGVMSQAEYRRWFFGHYHTDLEIDSRHTALFNSVIKLW